MISKKFRIGFRTIIFSNQMFDNNGSDTGYTGKPRLFYIVNGLPIFVRVSSNENTIHVSPFLLSLCAASVRVAQKERALWYHRVRIW